MAASSGNNKSPVSLFIIFARGLVVVVVLAAITPSANATDDNILGKIASLTVTGQVCCTTSGTCGPPPPDEGGVVPGLNAATANLVCTDIFGKTVTVATTTTSATGTYSFTVPGGLFSPFKDVLYRTCRVRIPLPVAGCAAVTTGAYQCPVVVITPPPAPTPFFNFFFFFNFFQPVSGTANTCTAVP